MRKLSGAALAMALPYAQMRLPSVPIRYRWPNSYRRWLPDHRQIERIARASERRQRQNTRRLATWTGLR